MADYKYINLSYLNEVSSGDPETKKQLIKLFFEQVDAIKNSFECALAINDKDEIRKTAHLAKSSTKIMGINNISEQMQKLEYSIKGNSETTDCKPYIDFFLNNIDNAIGELNQELAFLD
ncbi:MAG: Hpt domain-containing protein [Bacteroidales bacterium]|nr:Hpt domain-containing protein [Bacteroidales bacterium]